MEPIAVITFLALVEYIFFSVQVARARARTGIKAPAIAGAADFERHFRVQQNTLEQLVVFLPALWMFGLYVHTMTGAAIGLVFILGRFIYYRGYVKDPAKRTAGFLIGQAAQIVLLLGGGIGAVLSLLQGTAA